MVVVREQPNATRSNKYDSSLNMSGDLSQKRMWSENIPIRKQYFRISLARRNLFFLLVLVSLHIDPNLQPAVLWPKMTFLAIWRPMADNSCRCLQRPLDGQLFLTKLRENLRSPGNDKYPITCVLDISNHHSILTAIWALRGEKQK